jgi:hypothetical protein
MHFQTPKLKKMISCNNILKSVPCFILAGLKVQGAEGGGSILLGDKKRRRVVGLAAAD